MRDAEVLCPPGAGEAYVSEAHEVILGDVTEAGNAGGYTTGARA